MGTRQVRTGVTMLRWQLRFCTCRQLTSGGSIVKVESISLPNKESARRCREALRAIFSNAYGLAENVCVGFLPYPDDQMQRVVGIEDSMVVGLQAECEIRPVNPDGVTDARLLANTLRRETPRERRINFRASAAWPNCAEGSVEALQNRFVGIRKPGRWNDQLGGSGQSTSIPAANRSNLQIGLTSRHIGCVDPLEMRRGGRRTHRY